MRSAATRFLGVALYLAVSSAYAQKDLSGATEIQFQLDKLNVLGSLLMIGAHPDDENNALLAYFARGGKLRTGYLSATRGEGGRNLIGSEQGDLLGLIRTQELLAARRIDGGEQFFTRAIDFGFTKSVERTLAKWGHDRLLADMVWTIRRFRPDVIVLRFSGTPRDGHGQHQASAIVGKEAYFAAADGSQFSGQGLAPWRAKRLLFNIFAFTRQQEQEAEKTPGRLAVDVGGYSPVLGKSFTEIAAESRSQHRSQGQGTPQRRGSQVEYLLRVAGDEASKDPLDGVDTTWSRLPSGEAVGRILEKAGRAFAPEDPTRTIPLLVEARPLIARIAASEDGWAARKLQELDESIALCAGLRVDATADRATATPGSKIEMTLSAINRSEFPMRWSDFDLPLACNRVETRRVTLPVAAGEPYSQPFWLAKPPVGSSYAIDRQELIGRADIVPYHVAKFHIQVAGQTIELERAMQYRWVDPAEGELTRPVVIAPPAAMNLAEAAMVFPNGAPHEVEVQVTANVAKATGAVRLELAGGWRAEPESRAFRLQKPDEQAVLSFEVRPGAANATRLAAVATVDGKPVTVGMRLIRYPHIPVQTVFQPAEARVERVDVRTLSKKVGYVMGAGDEVPKALEQLGTTVTPLTADDLARRNLMEFDAIVTGVRAYNVRPDLRANQHRLLDYVHEGGTLIVQYNVAEGGPYCRGETGELANIGPYPLKVGCDRVTIQEAAVTFLKPDSPLLNAPNKITPADFEGWVQERGVHFASEWDPRYEAVIESHDPGEPPHPGGMLYARYGKGAYIFTAYAWFRQLPAGVPGAYRIFANLLSAGKVAR